MRERPAASDRQAGEVRDDPDHRVLPLPARERDGFLERARIIVRLPGFGDRGDDEPATLRIVGEIQPADLAAVHDAETRVRLVVLDGRFAGGAFPDRHWICGGTKRIDARVT